MFYAAGTPEAAGIYLGSLDGGAPTRLTAADSSGAFLPPDQVVFVQRGTLVARRLDLAGAALTGDAVTLADRVAVDTFGRGGFAVSGAGPVAYRAGVGAARHLGWVDRTGRAVGVADEPDVNTLQHPELSPDGRRVAMRRTVQGNQDIWLLDLVRGGRTRLTFDAARDVSPLWSPDGMRIAFSSNRTGASDLYLKLSNGSGAEERLVNSPNTKHAQDWSRDGRWLLYYEVNPTNGRDLWALDVMVPNRTPRAVANTPAEEVLAQFSPDGRYVAYQTNESGRFEVMVQPFPDPGGKWQVSTAGGVAPRWRADRTTFHLLAVWASPRRSIRPPDSFATDADRLMRCTGEAQTLASLNHPNIAHIHGLEEARDVRALVMELVEGDDLSERIAHLRQGFGGARDDGGRDDFRHGGLYESGAGAGKTVDKRADVWRGWSQPAGS